MQARVSPEVAREQDGVVFYRKVGCPRCNQTGLPRPDRNLPAAD